MGGFLAALAVVLPIVCLAVFVCIYVTDILIETFMPGRMRRRYPKRRP